MKPVLFVTGHVPADRAPAFEQLHARVGIELALYGGRHLHGAPPGAPPASVPHRFVEQREVGALVRSGAYRTIVAGTGGRVALPTAWRASQSAGVPFVFWAALWRTPRTAAHLAALPMLRSIYRRAAAIVTYGEHVSAYVRRHGAQRVFVAPQAVDNEFWSAPATPRGDQRFAALFVGRDAREKGLAVALEAWGRARLDATLTLVGDLRVETPPGVVNAGALAPTQLRNFYAGCDVLVVPSISTRRFIEPWGLVVNEAMNQGAAIIASDAVGAAAGGLVREGRNGLIVRERDSAALAHAMASLAGDRERCRALGAQGRADVAAYTFERWADAFARALETVALQSSSAGSVGR
jgi:glycosyltransferase involved in cell wall biosynthesis